MPDLRATPAVIELVVVAASLGGVRAISVLLASLPDGFPAAVAIVQHQLPSGPPGLLQEVLCRYSSLPVRVAADGAALEPGVVLIAPASRHFEIALDRTVRIGTDELVQGLRSAADPLFMSASAAYGPALAAVVLTGTLHDGTDGASLVRDRGGVVIVQNPGEARASAMPRSAIDGAGADWVLPLDAIGPLLSRLAAPSA